MRKSDLAYRVKLLPGPEKIVLKRTPIGQNSTQPSSLAGKRKLSPPKKTFERDHTQLKQGTVKTATTAGPHQATTEVVVIQESPQNTSGSSSLSINSWDGIIEDYFDDVSNKNMLFSQDTMSGLNHEISVLCSESSLPRPTHPSRPMVPPSSSDPPDTSL